VADTKSPDPLHGKRVAVLGFARQGQALARWLPTVGAQVVVSDQRSADKLVDEIAAFSNVEFVLGGHPETLLDGVDLLCLSGGVPLDLPIVQATVERGIPLSNDAQLFLERCPALVIGITGSAGKTTTTTLVGSIVQRAGYKTWVGGNIGDVLLDVLADVRPDDRVVMELSSFQLEIMSASPQIAAVLNITPNHLDRHGDMETYTRAKANILTHQTEQDAAVLGYDDEGSRSLEPLVTGNLIWFSGQTMVSNGTFLAGERLMLAGTASPDGDVHVICNRSDIHLRGEHNALNMLAACAITGAVGIYPEAMANVIRAFHGVAHRLEVVRVVNGVTYVNDSIATAPERVVAALRSYSEPLILLTGGKDKNLPWEEMIRLALEKSRHIIAFGMAGDIVMNTVHQVGGDLGRVTRVPTLEQAVAKAAALAQSGDVVLLSPGGTSYDVYTDFAERGEHFRQLVMSL
jgi:UDP-N-acetylmuramoylalanine--D-glutamate ligase